MRTLMVDQAYCVFDDGQISTARLPMDYWESLPAMAGRAHARMDETGGTLLLTGPACRELGDLPEGPDKAVTPPPTIPGRDGKLLTCDKWRPWMRYRSDDYGQNLYVGILPWMSRGDMPLLQKFPEDTERVLDLWRQVTGTPWYGAPAGAGALLLRSLVTTRDDRGRTKAPRFQLTPPTGDVPLLWAECEQTAHWTRKPVEGEPGAYRHTYDVRRAWLAAAHLSICAPEQLKHTGTSVTEYAARTAGLFLVRPYPWDHEYAGLLPDPAGPAPAGEPRWISHARLGLLDQLKRAGEHPGYDILDSYTAPGTELLRPWVDALERAFQTEELSSAVKAVYARTPSSMGTPPEFNEQTHRYVYRSIYRPDWKAEVIGMAEVNKWRALWKIGKQSGRWPVAIAEDQPTYLSAEPDGTVDGLALGVLQMVGDELDQRRGKFRLKGTRSMEAKGS